MAPAFGMQTIARGTLPLALFATRHYAAILGRLRHAARICAGGAPLLFGAVLDRGGPRLALLLSLGTLMNVSLPALFAVTAAAPDRAATIER